VSINGNKDPSMEPGGFASENVLNMAFISVDFDHFDSYRELISCWLSVFRG